MSFAEREERQKAEDEIEKQLLPLWLIRFAPYLMKGEKPPMSFEEFLKKTLDRAEKGENPAAAYEPEKTPDEIEAEFAPIIERDRRGG